MLPPTPLLRSKAGLAILARTHLEPDREFYLRELVRATGMAPRSIQVQLDRLVQAGVLSDRRDGNRSTCVRREDTHSSCRCARLCSRPRASFRSCEKHLDPTDFLGLRVRVGRVRDQRRQK